jgi:hypothetical protein
MLHSTVSAENACRCYREVCVVDFFDGYYPYLFVLTTQVRKPKAATPTAERPSSSASLVVSAQLPEEVQLHAEEADYKQVSCLSVTLHLGMRSYYSKAVKGHRRMCASQ